MLLIFGQMIMLLMSMRMQIQSHCITGYDSCSFGSSLIDDKHWDQHEFDQGGKTVLDGLSQTSICHKKTTQLIEITTKTNKY